MNISNSSDYVANFRTSECLHMTQIMNDTLLSTKKYFDSKLELSLSLFHSVVHCHAKLYGSGIIMFSIHIKFSFGQSIFLLVLQHSFFPRAP